MNLTFHVYSTPEGKPMSVPAHSFYVLGNFVIFTDRYHTDKEAQITSCFFRPYAVVLIK